MGFFVNVTVKYTPVNTPGVIIAPTPTHPPPPLNNQSVTSRSSESVFKLSVLMPVLRQTQRICARSEGEISAGSVKD